MEERLKVGNVVAVKNIITVGPGATIREHIGKIIDIQYEHDRYQLDNLSGWQHNIADLSLFQATSFEEAIDNFDGWQLEISSTSKDASVVLLSKSDTPSLQEEIQDLKFMNKALRMDLEGVRQELEAKSRRNIRMRLTLYKLLDLARDPTIQISRIHRIVEQILSTDTAEAPEQKPIYEFMYGMNLEADGTLVMYIEKPDIELRITENDIRRMQAIFRSNRRACEDCGTSWTLGDPTHEIEERRIQCLCKDCFEKRR